MQKYHKQIIVLILCLIFTALFLRNIKHDLTLIFQKDLLAHDESIDSVVSANLTHQFFPPMVRLNPLNEQQGNWMEGPLWQHRPALTSYVPYLFFKLDGQVTIEVKRLSYAFVIWLTGLLFILSVHNYRKSLLAGLAGTVAALFWINTPFTHELITGYAFGVSDIVLAFTVVCAFAGVIWYLREEKEQRLNYKAWQLAVVSILVALPIMAKSLLGAIPAATFLVVLIWDHRRLSKQILQSIAAIAGLLALYFFIFPTEPSLSFSHFQNLEGWGRPWSFYLTNYLPQRYLGQWTWVYYFGLIFALVYNFKRKTRITLAVALIWFFWNLIAVSLVTSKIPNFIYQSYLLSLYAIIYSLMLSISNVAETFRFPKNGGLKTSATLILLILSIFAAGYELATFTQQFQIHRAAAYNYQTEHEKFYQTAEQMRQMGLGTKDLTVVYVSNNDCWLRYYILFLTGAESKTLLELSFNLPPKEIVNQKYNRIFFVSASGIEQITYDQIKSLLTIHKNDILQNVERIKKDKTSCQWLVPDEVLNTP